jgi:hypothetical protein
MPQEELVKLISYVCYSESDSLFLKFHKKIHCRSSNELKHCLISSLHHCHWQNSPFLKDGLPQKITSYLSRIKSSSFHFSGFHVNNVLLSKVIISLASNPKPIWQCLCIEVPQGKGGTVITSRTGLLYHRAMGEVF